MSNLYCNFCKKSECPHIFFIYYEFYKIPINLIPILFCNNFDMSFHTKFYDSCISYLDSNDCSNCLDKLSSDLHLFKCNNLIHYKCIKEWINKKNECPI